MWRAMFMGIAITLCIIGLECLVIDKVVLAMPAAKAASGLPADYLDAGTFAAAAPPAKREIKPGDWAPFTFLSGGVVLLLYSLTLRSKKKAE